MDKHHIEEIFDDMLNDVRSIKISTYFLYRK